MNINNIMEIKNTVENKAEIYIFCAGTIGQLACKTLKDEGVYIQGFIDNDSEKWNTAINGVSVYCLQQIKELFQSRKRKLYIIIATYSEQIQMEILKQLKTECCETDYSVNMAYSCRCAAVESREKKKTDRYCQEEELFIKHNGDVYPCCRTWGNQQLRIGNISDPDISEKIHNFNQTCQCERFCLKSLKDKNQTAIQMVNIEFSLRCQGNCIPCCVCAPWTGEAKQYLYFGHLESFLKKSSVKVLRVQGGEVFIQKDTIDFLLGLKQKITGLTVAIVSNGNFPVSQSAEFINLFDQAGFSFMGFQPDTYKCIMGLERQKTLDFINSVKDAYKGKLRFAFITLPSTIHEICSFLEYTLEMEAANVLISDGAPFQYINPVNTWDSYWIKLMERSGAALRKLLTEKKQEFRQIHTRIEILGNVKTIYGLNYRFVEENGLQDIVHFI